MAMQPIDGIPQKQRVAIPRLVEALRGIHQRNPDITPASRHADSGGLLGHLARGGRDLTFLLGGGDASLRYSALRDHIKQLERQAQRHSELIDRLLRRGEPAPDVTDPVPYQETLYLQCQRGGRTAGRFRCVNRRGHKVAVSLATRSFSRNGTVSRSAPVLSVQPSSFALHPAATAVIVADVDLRSCPDLTAGKLQTSIDLRMDDAIALKLWIEMDIYE
jgi:hypothetical protein